VLPSDYLGLKTPWGRWQVDQVALAIGMQADREAMQNQTSQGAVGTGKTRGYRSAAGGRPLKKVKVRPNGTW